MEINKIYITRLSSFVVVTALFLAVLFATTNANGASAAGFAFSAADRVIEKSFEAEPGGILTLDSRVGTVDVQGWNKNEVHVKIEISGSDRYVDDVEFFMEGTAGGVSIKAEVPRSSSWFGTGTNRLNITYTINVPYEYDTDINTGGGGITISKLDGTIIGKTSGGGIKGEELTGKIQLSTSGGRVQVSKIRGETVLKTSGGSINVDDMSGDLDARTSGGPIRLTVMDARIQARTSGGSVELNYRGENKGITLETSGGGIRVDLPENIRANVSAKTSGGSVTFDFPVTVQGSISRTSIEGTINGGGPDLRLRTSGGSIRINKTS
jgi:DUF4097 and DUF4098 domain-containing protein YvlB